MTIRPVLFSTVLAAALTLAVAPAGAAAPESAATDRPARATNLTIDGPRTVRPEHRAKFTFAGSTDTTQAVYAKFFRVTKKHRTCAATFESEKSASFVLSDDVLGAFALKGTIHGVNLYRTGKYRVCAWLLTESTADVAAAADQATFRVRKPRR